MFLYPHGGNWPPRRRPRAVSSINKTAFREYRNNRRTRPMDEAVLYAVVALSKTWLNKHTRPFSTLPVVCRPLTYQKQIWDGATMKRGIYTFYIPYSKPFLHIHKRVTRKRNFFVWLDYSIVYCYYWTKKRRIAVASFPESQTISVQSRIEGGRKCCPIGQDFTLASSASTGIAHTGE